MNDVIKFLLSNATGFDKWFLSILILIGFSGWYYLGKEKKVGKDIAKKQILFAVVVVMLSILGPTIFRVFFSNNFTFPVDKKGILVLSFEGDVNNERFQSHLVSTINQIFSNDKNIIVRSSDDLVSEKYGLSEAHKTARLIGAKYNAYLVIWGNLIGEKKFHPRLTFVNNNLEHIVAVENTLSVQDIDDFNIPNAFTSFPKCFINLSRAFDFYEGKKYQAALSNMKYSLTELDTTSVDLSYINFLIGNCKLFLSLNDSTNQSEIDSAIFYYNNAINLNSSLFQAYNNRGIAHYINNSSVSSISDFRSAIILNPLSLESHNNYGNSLVSFEQLSPAINEYNLAIKLGPSYAIAYFNRGIVYYKSGNYDLAFNDLKQANKLGVGSSFYHSNLRKIIHEIAVIDSNNFDFYSLSQYDLTHKILFDLRGNHYYNISLYNLAIYYFSRLLDIDPRNSVIFFKRGNSFYNCGRFNEAIHDYLKAIELNSLYPEACYKLASCYKKLGLEKESKKYFDRAHLLNPSLEK